MAEQAGRKLAAILVSDVVGYSRLAGADEELTLARLRALRSDLIDPIVAVHHGRVVKRTGDGALVEFRSVVDAVRCAIETQTGLVERNAGLPPERRIEFRIGIHLGDVMEEADGDLMGDGVNIAARLETMCEPGGVCLSEDAYRQVRNRLDLAVTDLGDQALKNIAEPMRVYALTVGKPATARPAAQNSSVVPAKAGTQGQRTSPALDSRLRGNDEKGKARKPSIPVIAAAAGIAALIVIAAVAVWYFLARPGVNLAANAPAHLSIVVLPFSNLSNDPKQDYFADGITDNLTTDLSRIRNSFVIARNTAFTYKGKNVDAKAIGKELGVRYVLEGSVQRDGNRVRVNAQLIDAESGAHLWADRFEEDLADLFKLQDDVVARLANALGYELTKAEAEKGAHSANPDAIDLTMQGLVLIVGNLRDKTRFARAHELFERALKIDPTNADAVAGEARFYEAEFSSGLGAGVDYGTKITSLADRAIVMNPNVMWAYWAKATYLFLSRRAKESLEVANTGLAINPNFASLYMARRGAEISLGQFKQAADDVRHAMQLSPRDPEMALWHMQMAAVQFGLENFDGTIEEANKAIDGGYQEFQPYTYLAAVYALTGRQEEARAALAEAQRLNPRLTSMKWLLSHSPNMPRYFEGMRKAGVPEDEPAKHLSIVVLPFDNLSGDPKQDYFADGITDNLTTDLSRIRNSFVIARNTAFTFKGKNVDAKQIGKELGVRYVLEGSVQRDGNRVRVNAQLIDAESGSHLWADRFEEDLADLFKLQDDVVARLANALRVELANAESRMSYLERKQSPDAIDLSMRGWAIVWQQPKKGTNLAARDFFERALRVDPDNDNALAGIAVTYMREHAYGWIDPKVNYDDKVVTPADRAIAINPDNAMAYYAKGVYLGETRRTEEALTAAETGLRNNPNFAPLYFTRAYASIGLGRSEQTKADLQHAMRLSPRDPQTGIWYSLLGGADIQLGHYEAAIDDDRKSIDSGYRVFLPYADLAAAYALAGKIDEAKAALAEARKLNPRLTMKWYSARGPNTPMVYEGLRKAGLPEEDAPPPPKHLSIVVLPFTNLSGDPKQDYFADGITDNLTTDLSRIRNSFVIARNTAFTYKGKNVDAREIGKELDVRYVLEGSVQRDGNRVRVNAQLIDAESGAHLWADRFEEDLADLFKLQDDVVARLANTLGYELVKAEADKGTHSTNPDAVDLTMRGQEQLFQGFVRPTKEKSAAARNWFDQALKIDPDNADALVGDAWTYLGDYAFGWGAAGTDYDAKILIPVDRALGFAPENVSAYFVKSTYLYVTRRAQASLDTANAGLALNRNFAPLYMARRGAEVSLGRYEQAKSDVLQAMRLSPHDPEIGFWHVQLGAVEIGLGNFDNAVSEGQKGIEAGFRNYIPYINSAAADALAGKIDAAKSSLAEARRLNPNLTIKWMMNHAPNIPALFDGLRKAGLPEQ